MLQRYTHAFHSFLLISEIFEIIVQWIHEVYDDDVNFAAQLLLAYKRPNFSTIILDGGAEQRLRWQFFSSIFPHGFFHRSPPLSLWYVHIHPPRMSTYVQRNAHICKAKKQPIDPLSAQLCFVHFPLKFEFCFCVFFGLLISDCG